MNVQLMDTDVILKRFEQPDEVREFPLGKFELVTLGGMTIGRATYQPGWKWSVHDRFPCDSNAVIRTAGKHDIGVNDAQIRAKMTELDLCTL